MKRWMTNAVVLVAVAVSLSWGATLQAQQIWTSKPVRIITASVPGTTGDLLARLAIEPAVKALGGTPVVEARTGAGGTIATDAAAKAAPDGYTFGVSAMSSLAIGPALNKDIQYDVYKDFRGVARLATNTNVIVTGARSSMTSMKALIDYARANPKKVSFGLEGGYGTSIHMGAVLLGSVAKADLFFVPFKNATDTQQALISGDLPVASGPLASYVARIKDGSLRALGVTSAKRSPSLPEAPSVNEASGLDYDVSSWFGLVAPAAAPRAIIDAFSAELVKTLGKPDIIAALARIGFDAAPMGSDEFEAFRRAEAQRWAAVVKESGVKVE